MSKSTKYAVIAWIGKDNETSRMKFRAVSPEDAVRQLRDQFSLTTVRVREVRPA
jgi:hypothetical protein